MRKYNSEIRKKMVSRIGRITNKSDLIAIYEVINQDIGDNFSSNRNGIFINLNIVSDKCIEQLSQIIDKLNVNNTESEQKIQYKGYNKDEVEKLTDLGHKLSNQEKIIIKRVRNNEIFL